MSVASIQKEIERLQTKKAAKAKSLASKSSKIAQLSRAISSTKSASTARNKLKQIQTLEKDSAKLQTDIAKTDSDIAKKTEKLHKAQRDHQKKQDAEQKRILRSLEQSRAADQTRQREALSQAHIEETDLEEYDAFISHASEDKEEVARPLAEALVNLGLKVWYDETQLTVGDSLRQSIDRGLGKSRFGIVVLSPSFFAKNWTQYELDGLMQREMNGGKVILPIWHKVSKTEVQGYSLSLADKVALNRASYTVEEIATKLEAVLKGT